MLTPTHAAVRRSCLALIGLFWAPVTAQPEPSPPAGGAAVRAVGHAEAYAPTPIPDRIVLTWSEDPRTTQTVTWRTSMEVSHAFAEIAPASHGPEFRRSAVRVDATSNEFCSDLSEARVHRVVFRGLEPGGVYAYRVGDGTNWSAWNHFRTEPAEREPFSFVYFGDAQNDVRSLWSRVVREAFRDAPRAAFFLHAGDLVNRASSDGEWGEWFEAAGWINATVPVIATPGNHEYTRVRNEDGTSTRSLTTHWNNTFTFPDNGPSGLEGTAWFIDYADLRVISLNSNELQAEQCAWIDDVLATNTRRWVVVTFHHPLYALAVRRDNSALRAMWKPIFDRHGVDLVLAGHDHTYGRTGLVGPEGDMAPFADARERNMATGTRERDGVTGTVYVVSVSGPKMYEQGDDAGVTLARAAEDTQLYQIITIRGDELRYEARTAVGEVYDGFSVLKRPGRPNELIEGGPFMPARRR